MPQSRKKRKLTFVIEAECHTAFLQEVLEKEVRNVIEAINISHQLDGRTKTHIRVAEFKWVFA